MKNCFFLFLFFILPYCATSQCADIAVSGKVIDTNSIQRFYNFMVVNRTTQKGKFSSADGSFFITAQQEDELIVKIKNYEHVFISLKNVKGCSVDTLIYLHPKIQSYKEVIVYPIKPLETIKKEREALVKPEKYSVTGLAAFKSPITALYERFSKREKSRQLAAELEHQQEINDIVKSLLRTYVSYDVVYLKEDQFTDFIYFLEIDEEYLKTAKDYDLVMFIQGKLEKYKQLHPEIFPH